MRFYKALAKALGTVRLPEVEFQIIKICSSEMSGSRGLAHQLGNGTELSKLLARHF